MSSEKPYSFFQSVERSFDKAAKFTDWDPGILRADKSMQQRLPNAFPCKG